MWVKVFRFGQNLNHASPKTFDLPTAMYLINYFMIIPHTNFTQISLTVP